MNVKWLREQLGLVSQQPILFDCSIEDNIRYGLPGASHEQVVEVAKQANAHKFIMDFPEGYGTSVGQGSTLISGGKWSYIFHSIYLNYLYILATSHNLIFFFFIQIRSREYV